MKMRTRNVTVILLVIAMIFGMDAFSFAAETTEEAAFARATAVDASMVSVTEAGAELSVWYGDSVEIDGWHMPDEARKFYKDGVIECYGKWYVDPTTSAIGTESIGYLQGSTASRDLRIKIDTSGNEDFTKTTSDGGSQTMQYFPGGDVRFEIYAASLEDRERINPNNKLTLTLASNNDLRAGYGYSYLDNVLSDEDFDRWAASVCREGVKYSLDLSKKDEYVTCTFFEDEEYLSKRTDSFGYVTRKFRGGSISYNSFASFPTYTHKNPVELNMMVNLDYGDFILPTPVKKFKLKHKKKWGNKVRIYISKLHSGGKQGKALIKEINKANLEITIYPYDLISGNEYSNSHVSFKKFNQKGNGKQVLTLQEEYFEKMKTFTLKNGKSDGWGGKIELTPSGNGVTVSGSNMFTGYISR